MLHEYQVYQILELLDRQHTNKSIAQFMGCSQNAVSRIKNGVYYADKSKMQELIDLLDRDKDTQEVIALTLRVKELEAQLNA